MAAVVREVVHNGRQDCYGEWVPVFGGVTDPTFVDE